MRVNLSEYHEIPVESAEVFIAAHITKSKEVKLKSIPGSGRVLKINGKYYYYDNNPHGFLTYLFPWLRGRFPYNTWELDESWVKENLRLYKNYQDLITDKREENPSINYDDNGVGITKHYTSSLITGRLLAPAIIIVGSAISTLIFGSYRIPYGAPSEIAFIIFTVLWACFLFILINYWRELRIIRLGFQAKNKTHLSFVKLGSVTDGKFGYGFGCMVIITAPWIFGLSYLFSGRLESNLPMIWWQIFYICIVSGGALMGLWATIGNRFDKKNDYAGIMGQISNEIKDIQENIKLYTKGE